MVYKDKVAFLASYISVMESNVWFRNGLVTQAKSYTRRFKILISPMIYNDLLAFLASHISVMENNEISSEIEMDLFDLENPYISYELQG